MASNDLRIPINDSAQGFSGSSPAGEIKQPPGFVGIARLAVFYGYPVPPGVLNLNDKFVHGL